MIPIAKLIAFYSERLQEHPPIPTLNWSDVCVDTIVYLNSYRHVRSMLEKLAENPDVQKTMAEPV